MIPTTDSTDTDPSVTRRTTTVSTMRPITSSATAAPSTMRASVVASARRSPNTRAVMPTLVAVSAAPTNSAVLNVLAHQPHRADAQHHRRDHADGGHEHRGLARPCRARGGPSPCPTSSRSRITPISPSVRRTSSLPPTALSTDGPMRMPATISPTTAGTPMRSAISAAALAAIEHDEDVAEDLGDVHGSGSGEVKGRVVGRAPGGHGPAVPARWSSVGVASCSPRGLAGPRARGRGTCR